MATNAYMLALVVSIAFLPTLSAAQESIRTDAMQTASINPNFNVLGDALLPTPAQKPKLTEALIREKAMRDLERRRTLADQAVRYCSATSQTPEDDERCDVIADEEVPMDFNTGELTFDFSKIDHEPARPEMFATDQYLPDSNVAANGGN